MQIDPIKSAALLDTNNDGALREIRNPALKQELATLPGSGWSFAADTISTSALGSLIEKASRAADSSPTVRKAADAVAVSEQKLDKLVQQEKADQSSVRSWIGTGAGVGMIGGFFVALMGLPTLGLALVTAGAVAGLITMGWSLFKAKDDSKQYEARQSATAEHQAALAELIRAYKEVANRRAEAAARSENQLSKPM